jgi:hypothetical protein
MTNYSIWWRFHSSCTEVSGRIGSPLFSFPLHCLILAASSTSAYIGTVVVGSNETVRRSVALSNPKIYFLTPKENL